MSICQLRSNIPIASLICQLRLYANRVYMPIASPLQQCGSPCIIPFCSKTEWWYEFSVPFLQKYVLWSEFSPLTSRQSMCKHLWTRHSSSARAYFVQLLVHFSSLVVISFNSLTWNLPAFIPFCPEPQIRFEYIVPFSLFSMKRYNTTIQRKRYNANDTQQVATPRPPFCTHSHTIHKVTSINKYYTVV